MKRIIATAVLVLAGSALSSVTCGETLPARVPGHDKTSGKIVEHNAGRATPESMPKVVRDHFLYRDMVQKKHPVAIRNAVIIYGHFFPKRQPCTAREGKDVRECWLGPTA